jgi:hypothetical protein
MRFLCVALMVLVVACGGGGGGGGDGGGGGSSGADDDSGGDLGAAAADPSSGALVGDTDTVVSHWDDGEPWDQPAAATQRAYGGDVWSTVSGYPQAMNGCASTQRRVSWRSLGGPLYAGLTTYPSYGELQTFATPEAPVENVDSEGWVDVEADEPATEGRLILNACEQPVFRTTEPNVLVDYVVDVTEHAPEV